MSDETNSKRYHSTEEIEAVVRKFESCELPLEEFNHRAHLTVALWYLLQLPVVEATGHMRTSLHRFINYYGRQGYNETITLFWVKITHRHLDDTDTNRPIPDVINEVIEQCGNSQLIFNYYSKARISSKEAQTTWMEPDLKPLEF